MHFSRYFLALAPLLATSVLATPWKVIVDDEIATSNVGAGHTSSKFPNMGALQAEWQVTWVPTVPVVNYMCPYDDKIWVSPPSLKYPSVRETLSRAVTDYIKGYENPLVGGSRFEWDNARCQGKKNLFKYDVSGDSGERSPYRLVFHFEDYDEHNRVAVVNFCGV
ncbi:hypothetical protein FRC06_004361, partial [Ceratobasidium sp. 370]